MESNILENTRILSQWNRLVGSSGEQAAREWIVAQFEKIGVPVSRETFTCTDYVINVVFRLLSPFLSITFSLTFLCAKLNLLPDWGIFTAIILVLILTLVLPRVQEMSFGKQGRLIQGKNYTSENIIGSLDSPTTSATIILMGHYDSKSQVFRADVRVGLFIISWFWILIMNTRLLIAQIAKSLLLPVAGTIWDVDWVEIVIPCIMGGLLLFNSIGNTSPGSLDNASGVSILLNLALYFKEHPLKRITLKFVVSSAEELGLYGADAYIRSHASEFDKNTTFFLVYDSPAMKGPLWLLNSYGVPRKVLCKEVADLLLQVGQQDNIQLRSVWTPFGAATDHVPIAHAGFKVGVIAGPIGRVHTPQDSIETISLEGLERAALLGKAFIQEIEKRLSRA